MFQKEQELVNAVEEIKKNILIINGLIMKVRIKNPIWGVPITFLNNYCPTQFKIIDINPHFFSIVEQGLPKPKQLTLHNVGKKDPYARILIKKIQQG